MPRLRLICALLATAGTLWTGTGSALALSPVVADCKRHNSLTRHYTVPQLRNGLNTIPADIKEYSSCYDIIQTQLFGQLGKLPPGTATTAGSGGGGSSVLLPVVIVLGLILLAGGGAAFYARGRGGGPPPA